MLGVTRCHRSLCAVGILRRAISGERPDADGAGDKGPPQVLAKDVQSEGSDVPGGSGGDPRRHRTPAISEDHGASLPPNR